MLGKAQIKVLIIGKDGVARKNWVDYDAPFYDNKYRIDLDAVFQSLETSLFGLISKAVPTILFRENSVIAISHKTKATIPDPDEMGSSISRAAWAIAELMRKKNEQLMMYLLLAIIACCIIAAASTFFAYSAGGKIDKLQTTVNQLSLIQANATPTDIHGLPIIPIVHTPVSSTLVPTPTGTPVPAISVT